MLKMSEKPKDLRPREKLQTKGAAALSDYELIMAIIGSGSAAADVTKLARDVQKLLKDKGELTYADLLKIRGLGAAKATNLMASYELWRRQFEKPQQPIIRSNEDVLAQLADIRDKKQEYLICITLDGANRVINRRVISIGTVNFSVVHPREVYADAIADRAASIIVAHNHPGGTLTPSDPDIRATKRLRDAADLLGIIFYDHFIVTATGYCSILNSPEWLAANNLEY